MESVIDFIKRTNFNPSKKMGQNFLINPEVQKGIVDKIDFNGVDCVIEIGPGYGAITDYLIDKTPKLICIELDKRLAEHIAKRYKDKSNFELINNDVLKVDFNKLTKNYSHPIIVSNLPYSISSLVIIQFIKSNIKDMYCMLQKEMVERIIAKPKTKQYNAFTVLLARYAKIEKLLNVGKNNFIPAPEVDSMVVSLIKSGESYNEKFDKFIRSCFLSKRRTLLNNLQSLVSKEELTKILIKEKINVNVRAEELSVSQLVMLYNILT
jgi:16S rRNA (adenine1518-N6/adenine1519-N6)-dimethyltransferase